MRYLGEGREEGSAACYLISPLGSCAHALLREAEILPPPPPPPAPPTRTSPQQSILQAFFMTQDPAIEKAISDSEAAQADWGISTAWEREVPPLQAVVVL
jgi:hypothetical protein